MFEQSDINQTIKESEYADTSATGNAAIYIYNYYSYREEVGVAPVKSDETATDDKLPSPYRGLFHFGPESYNEPAQNEREPYTQLLSDETKLRSPEAPARFEEVFPSSAEFFFGREVFVAELVQATRTHNVLAHLLAVQPQTLYIFNPL